MIGTLPPIKSISDFTVEQVPALSKHAHITFYNFQSVYPNSLAKAKFGELKAAEKKSAYNFPETENVEVKRTLNWWNPLSAFWAGFSRNNKILHMHYWSFYLVPVLFSAAIGAKMRGKKVVLELHNVDDHDKSFFPNWFTSILFYWPRNWMFRHADGIIAHSQNNRASFSKKFGIPESKIAVLPFGTFTQVNVKPLTKAQARKSLGISSKETVLLSFGNIREYKGIDVLMKSFAQVRQKFPNATLVIAGRPWAPWKPYQELMESLNIQSKTKLFLDYISLEDMQAMFVSSDVVVLPYTKFDGQSGNANQALSLGKALIVSDVGGLPELAQDPSMIVSAGSVESLTKTIEKLLSNPKMQKNLEQKAIRWSQENGWEKIAQKTGALYNKLLKGYA